LEWWLASVEQYKVQNTEHAGAIVMNCNPFTRGHRYLIQQASQQVDVLYIFVVEENKSFFDFQDRLHMVKLGVADLENVVVIPSGKYMISTVTLPGYFEKETCPFAEFDATEDLVLFADVIAKRFDIRVRFAGEEPKDAFTNRYNESMGRILPEHGVNFVEIPRMCLENEVVSASLVRKYMAEGRWEEIQKLVLPEIYAYLWENYREEC
jgi:[citrate (pro-3S)-lyase] ligase